jgi:hypothetical protein
MAAMKAFFLILIALFSATSSWASPIAEFIQSEAKMKEAGLTVVSEPREMPSAVNFVVTWTPPVAKEENAMLSRPTMDLLVAYPGEAGNENAYKMKLFYKPDKDGKCRAEFTIAETSVKDCWLRLWWTQSTYYVLELGEHTKGFEKNQPPIEK